MSGMNSGYCGYSMSRRASEAYENGEKPLSKWTKKEIIEEVEKYMKEHECGFSMETLRKAPAATVKGLILSCSSWHHTSIYVNKTDFYSIDYDELEKITDSDIVSYSEYSQNIAAKQSEKTAYRGDIRYLEWSGTRNHPRATEHTLTDVNIEERGSFYIVTDDSGTELVRKKIGSNGTEVTNYEEVARRNAWLDQQAREAREREQFVRTHSSPEAIAFYDEIKETYTTSSSNHLYPKGRKPGPWEYDHGLSNWFKVGEHRLFREYGTGILHLETWNGTEWIVENKEESGNDDRADN